LISVDRNAAHELLRRFTVDRTGLAGGSAGVRPEACPCSRHDGDGVSAAMNPALWPEVRRWVGELDEADEAERERRLAELPPEVAHHVRVLLASNDPVLSERMVAAVGRRAAEFLAADAAQPPEATAPQSDLAGLRLGAWQLVRPLGRGGMAEVWEALRVEGDYEHRAAVKLLKRGMDSEEVVARFRRERQILARLEHPAIARILDGGQAPDGRPYLVLEKVDGEPVTAWCARTGADVPRRLGLLVEICEAVAAAHRQLVVHRDLKPSNILVGADGRVKLLDFGIAKLLDASEDETRSEVRLLTPAYAAPEQILGEPISTSTDVYAIGVLAYELLTGRLPHRRSIARAAELVAALTRESVVRPSTAVLEAADGAATAAVSGDPHRLARRLRGDLDAIVLTALRRDPARRYASVEAFAEDLRRALDGRPVLARPDSLVYRASKFVGRHRVAVAAAVVAVAAVLGGLGAALWQADRAERAAAEATAKATEAEAIAEFVTEVFTAADPEAGAAADRTARELVARGAEKISTDLADQPATRAAMLHVLGRVQYRLAMHDSARELLGEALDLRRKLVPPREADIATSAAMLGVVEHRLGDSAAGAALLEEAVALHELALGSHSPQVANDLNNLANTYRVLGRVEEARAAFERAVAILERDVGGRADLARALNNYGLFLDRNAEDEAARTVLERALALHEETSGPQSAVVVGTLGNLAMLYQSLGDADRAVAAARRAFATSVTAYGPEHFESGMAENTLGWVLLRSGRPGEARPILEQSVAHLEAKLGPSHSHLGYSYRNLGEALAASGEPAAAIAALRRAAELWETAWGADASELVSVYRPLAPLLVAYGESEEAERLALRTVELRAEAAADQRLEAWLDLARIRIARCRLDAAREAVVQASAVVGGEAVDGAAAIAAARAEIDAVACAARAED
jgi:eukaryotic-like serine/threonine-protein kinase